VGFLFYLLIAPLPKERPLKNKNKSVYYSSMQTCKKCNIEKPLTEFHKESKGKYGVKTKCKNCSSKAKVQKEKIVKPKKTIVSPVEPCKVVQKENIPEKVQTPVIEPCKPEKVPVIPEPTLIDRLRGKNFMIVGNSESSFIHLTMTSPRLSVEGKTFEELEKQL
jgi:hypothetical protein